MGEQDLAGVAWATRDVVVGWNADRQEHETLVPAGEGEP